MLRLLSLLPLPVLYALCWPVVGALWLTGWRRDLTLEGLERCLPDVDAAGRRRLAREFYRWLGQLAAEVDFQEASRLYQERLRAAAESLYAGCQAAAIEPLLDDRDDRPGIKFKFPPAGDERIQDAPAVRLLQPVWRLQARDPCITPQGRHPPR